MTEDIKAEVLDTMKAKSAEAYDHLADILGHYMTVDNVHPGLLAETTFRLCLDLLALAESEKSLSITAVETLDKLVAGYRPKMVERELMNQPAAGSC